MPLGPQQPVVAGVLVSFLLKRLCKKLAVIFQRVGGLILATEQSDPSLVVSGHISDWRCGVRSKHLWALYSSTPQRRLSMLAGPVPRRKHQRSTTHVVQRAGQYLFLYL